MFTNYDRGDIVYKRDPVTAREAHERGRVIAVHAHGVTVLWPSTRSYQTFAEVKPEAEWEDPYLPPVLRTEASS